MPQDSMSNEPFLLIRSYVHNEPLFLLFHANNTLSALYKPLQQEFFSVFSFFLSQKNKHDPMFSQGFLENQSFNTKIKIKLMFVLINKF